MPRSSRRPPCWAPLPRTQGPWGASFTDLERDLARHIAAAPDPKPAKAKPTKIVRFHDAKPKAQPKPKAHKPKAHKPKAQSKPKAQKPEPKAQPKPARPSARHPRATPSYYIHSAAPDVLRAKGCRVAARVSSAAAIDAEPAWNPSFIRTRDFFRGYRPKEAHPALAIALREHPTTWVRRMPAVTNIRWD